MQVNCQREGIQALAITDVLKARIITMALFVNSIRVIRQRNNSFE